MQAKKKTLRETLLENQRGLDAWANAFGVEQTVNIAVPEKRKRAAPKPSTIPTEHQEQVAFIKWFRQQHRGVRVFAVPNAAMRSPQLAAYLKAEGLSPGCPDIWIPEYLMAIEMKRGKGGVLSPEQQEWGAYLRGIGWTWAVCRGFEEAKFVVDSWCRRNGAYGVERKK